MYFFSFFSITLVYKIQNLFLFIYNLFFCKFILLILKTNDDFYFFSYTPLHQAAQQGHTQIVNLLLESKAEPNTETKVMFL